MNKAELITTCAGYLHRSDMNAQIESGIAMATARIGRDLRDKSNQITDYFTPSDTGGNLPDYVVDITNVLNSNGSPLQSATIERMGMMTAQNPSGAPAFYALNGRLFVTSPPYDTNQFVITFFRRPVDLVNANDSNDVLTAWPQLYVYAVLMESFFWTQDGDLTQYATQSYNNEIQKINAAWSGAGVGSSPAMRRV